MLVNLMVQTKIDDYDIWLENGFKKDAERRVNMCDESKTIVAKISQREALILLYDVDIQKLREHMHDPVMKELEAQFNASHIVNTFSPID
jgi:hypothetical protein